MEGLLPGFSPGSTMYPTDDDGDSSEARGSPRERAVGARPAVTGVVITLRSRRPNARFSRASRRGRVAPVSARKGRWGGMIAWPVDESRWYREGNVPLARVDEGRFYLELGIGSQRREEIPSPSGRGLG